MRHKLEGILIIGLCSVICQGEDSEDTEVFGNERKDWLGEFLELPHGIPDSDTFRRVFERMDPQGLSKWLNGWLETEKRLAVASCPWMGRRSVEAVMGIMMHIMLSARGWGNIGSRWGENPKWARKPTR